MDPKQIVRRGYDRVSSAYRGDIAGPESAEYQRYSSWVDWLKPHLPIEANVLDLGCGNGIPASQLLQEAGFQVTGVDLSPVQVKRARRLVHGAKFIQGDMAQLEFSPGSFSAVVAFYSIIHVPIAEQPGLFARIHDWLVPGGYLLVIVGEGEWTGVEQDWLGVKDADMYWSHTDLATYKLWLSGAGFTILETRFIPEGDSGHNLVFAKRR